MALTDDYTYQFPETGIILNSNAVLPFVDIYTIKGLDSSPYRITTHTREGMDGGFIDAEFEEMRTVILEGLIYADPSQIAPYLDSLKANFGPARLSQSFNFKEPGNSQRTLFAKSLGIKCDTDTLRRIGSAKIQFHLQAEDPTIYGPQSVTTATLASAITGRSYNKAYNYGYGGSSGAGLAYVNNTGNKYTGGTLRIYNTLNPSVVMSSADGTVVGRLNFTIDVNDVNYLEISLRNRSIYLNGTAARRDALNGGAQWFKFPPQTVSSVGLLGTASGGVSQMTITTRPAYL